MLPDVAAALRLCSQPTISLVTVHGKGSFMFMYIEGGEAVKRKETADKERNETASRLWEISCCDQNVFNKTNFKRA